MNRSTNPYNQPTLGKWFRCGLEGHLLNECPKYQTLAIMDEEEAQDFIDSGDLDENTSYVEPDEGDQLSCVL